jgi:hypothetical protein
MGEFFNSLQKGKILYPTQKKFTLSYWSECFNSYSETDNDDKRLFEAGQWVFNKLELIREKIATPYFSPLIKEEAIQAIFGFVNRDCAILLNVQEKEIIPNDTVLTLGVLNKKRKFEGALTELSSADKFESTIEAIKYPLLQTYHSANFSNKKSRTHDDKKILNSFSKALNYGQYYLFIEIIWGDCLWSGYSIESKEKYDLVKPPDDDNSKLKAIAQYRLDSIKLESNMHLLKTWKNELPEEIKKQLIDIVVVDNIIRSGKSKKYILGKYKYDKNSPPFSLIAELEACELYFYKLLDESLPNLKEVTLRQLFRVWHLLFSLAEILKDRLPKDTSVLTINKLKLFSTQIKKKELINIIADALNVNTKIAYKVIDLFLFNGKNEEEVWTTPFYEYQDKLYFAFGTLLFPNLLRSLENWIKKSGFDLSERGILFEEYVRTELADSINESSIIKNAGVHPKALIISSGNIDEEIDLVFWLGNKVIIGELKCILFLTSPLEHYRYHRRLTEAATQIKRKTEAVNKNKKEFLNILSFDNNTDDTKIEIIPIIITNLLFGSGKIVEDIPVIDLLLLNRYLSEGNMPLYVETSTNSEDKIHNLHKFYNNEQEAIDNIYNFIKAPPLLVLYSNFIRKDKDIFPAINNDDKPIIKEYLEVVIKDTELSDISNIKSV